MSYRNKTYVCFDGDTEIHYYRLMCAWKQNDGLSFNFYNAHDLNKALDTSSETTIKRKLKERLNNSKVFVVLIGEKTRYLHKFVKWEIEQALSMRLPIIAVNLNGLRSIDSQRCPPVIRDQLAIHISYNLKIMQYSLNNWPDKHLQYYKKGIKGPYNYLDTVYDKLGL